jgi:hypothetical protein
MRNLNKNAATVAQLRIGADSAAMIEIEQDLKTHLDDLVAFLIVHVGDEANATSVMLFRRVVQSLRGGEQRVTADGRLRHLPGGAGQLLPCCILCDLGHRDVSQGGASGAHEPVILLTFE